MVIYLKDFEVNLLNIVNSFKVPFHHQTRPANLKHVGNIDSVVFKTLLLKHNKTLGKNLIESIV